MEKTENKIVVFFDTIGRLIIGEKTEVTETQLTVKNPAVVHIQPNPQSGQLSLQILPLFFREFLADKSESTIWKYNRSLITESNDIVFDFKLQAQYQQLFSPQPQQAPAEPSQNNPEVIKLFDE
jgi:hypothetical protein